MSWHTVPLGVARSTPWRNGGGVTRELVAWPDATHWVWRMSVAEIASNGPFSRFENVQRWFAVLDGAGVQLQVQNLHGVVTHTLDGGSAPVSFDGAVPLHCELLNGTTQDFNLMLRGPGARGEMQRFSGHVELTLDAPKFIAVYAIHTEASIDFCGEVLHIPPQTLVWQSLLAGTRLQLNAPNALWMGIAL